MNKNLEEIEAEYQEWDKAGRPKEQL